MTTRRKTTRDVERKLSRAAFIASLRRLADALEMDKPLVLQVKGERIRIPSGAAFSIEHEREGAEEEVELQLKWKRDRSKSRKEQ